MIDVPKIGTKVRNTYQNFTGIVQNEPISGRILVLPENDEIKNLYPFGINSLIIDLEFIDEK